MPIINKYVITQLYISEDRMGCHAHFESECSDPRLIPLKIVEKLVKDIETCLNLLKF